MLEQEFYKHNLTHVRILNMAGPFFAAGHNLNIFLQLLEQDSFQEFIWHNDFRANDSIFQHTKEDLFTFLPNIKLSLMRLSKKHPNILEISQLLNEIDTRYPNLKLDGVASYRDLNRRKITTHLFFNQFKSIITGTKHNLFVFFR